MMETKVGHNRTLMEMHGWAVVFSPSSAAEGELLEKLAPSFIRLVGTRCGASLPGSWEDEICVGSSLLTKKQPDSLEFSPHLNPLPTRASRREEEKRATAGLGGYQWSKRPVISGFQGKDENSKKVFQRVLGFLVIQAILLLLALCFSGCGGRQEGKVLNQANNQPIADAVIYHDGQTIRSDAQGRFKLNSVNLKKPLLVKAPGFRQTSIPLKRFGQPDVRLQPFAAKAVYLSQAGVGAESLRDPAIKLVDDTDLNALIVDVKGQRGLLSFSWEIPLGHEIGGFSKISIDDPDAFVRRMHEKKIYLIGRIAVFKDETLAYRKKQWAVLDVEKNKPFKDADKIPWMDPFQEPVWEYNLAVAKAAAEVGFDEIQFDYVRFPGAQGVALKFSKESTKEARVETINQFLKRAYEELLPYNVYVSAAVSGTALWRKGDAEMGLELEKLASLVDYISPYTYPSDIPSGALGLSTNSAVVPREAVSAALKIVLERIDGKLEKIRPWLQHFKDYSKLRLEFKEEQISEQMIACQEMRTSGWMLFNAENKYPYAAGALQIAAQPSAASTQTARKEP